MVGVHKLHYVGLQPPHRRAVAPGRDHAARRVRRRPERHAKGVDGRVGLRPRERIAEHELGGEGPRLWQPEIGLQRCTHQHRRHLAHEPALDALGDPALHHEVDAAVGHGHVAGGLVPALPLGQARRRRPRLAAIVRPDHHQVLRVTQDIECIAGDERTRVHEREVPPEAPRRPVVIGGVDAALPEACALGDLALWAGQVGDARTAPVGRGDQPPAGQPGQARAVAEDALRIGRGTDSDRLVGERTDHATTFVQTVYLGTIAKPSRW